MEKLIKERLGENLKLVDELFKTIEKYDRIAIFRHEKPDFDALGSQLGMATFIKDNWPNKEVVYVGDPAYDINNGCFPEMMDVDDSWYEKDFLAIILDLSNLDRIAGEKTSKAKFTIKIDHHPLVEHFGDIEIVDPTMSAVGEFLASIFLSQDKYKVSETCAQYLFKAIVGDSGRFMYSETSAHTFLVSEKLLETGFNLNEAYHQMYDDKQSSLKVKAFVLKHYKVTKNGVAYYILKDKQLRKFGLRPIQGKSQVNTFAHCEGIKIWLSVTEDRQKGNWRVSIRSGGANISTIAEQFGGGGHFQASATKLKSLNEVKKLIEALDHSLE